jgi:hypothetical protein
MRRGFPDRADAVVTAGAALRCGAVIETGYLPISSGMACVAVERSLYVRS